MTANYPVDLHSHTCLSDGADNVKELVLNAVAAGVKVLALTDHDVIPPAEIQLPGGGCHDLVEWAAAKGLCLLRGIEFSCERELEDVHIVALGCDWTNKKMISLCRQIAEGKVVSYQETIHRLNEKGYALSLEEVLQFGREEVDVLELQKKRIFDCLAAKGYTKTWAEAKLLVRDDSYLNVKREKPDARQVIELIHETGGVAILAHPYLIDPVVKIAGSTMKRWDYISRLVDCGLDGMEVRYPYDKTSCKEQRPREELWAEIRQNFPEKLFVSGGSDYHADHKKGNKNPRGLGECGLLMEEFEAVPLLKNMYNEIMNR